MPYRIGKGKKIYKVKSKSKGNSRRKTFKTKTSAKRAVKRR